MVQAGFARTTEDIDLLIDSSAGNQERVRRGLMQLPDQAVRDLASDDVDKYSVVRVADEFVVDLMKSACGIGYEEAKAYVTFVDIGGVKIPFASPELLWKLKQTRREKDQLDLLFLRELLKKQYRAKGGGERLEPVIHFGAGEKHGGKKLALNDEGCSQREEIKQLTFYKLV